MTTASPPDVPHDERMGFPVQDCPGTRPSHHDGFAIASLVLGLCWLAGFGSLLAVVFGLVSHGAAKARGARTSGMAIAGVILGCLGLVLAVGLIILLATVHPQACTPSSPAWPSC